MNEIKYIERFHNVDSDRFVNALLGDEDIFALFGQKIEERQVRYFEFIEFDFIESEDVYPEEVKDTRDFLNAVYNVKMLCPSGEVVYIEYDDGTTEGQPIYKKIEAEKIKKNAFALFERLKADLKKYEHGFGYDLEALKKAFEVIAKEFDTLDDDAIFENQRRYGYAGIVLAAREITANRKKAEDEE